MSEPKTITIPVPIVLPLGWEVTSKTLEEAWDNYWRPLYSVGVQSVEQRIIAATLRAVYVGLLEAEGATS